MQLDPRTDTLMSSIPFLHLVLSHLLRCGEPISEIISKSTESLGISGDIGPSSGKTRVTSHSIEKVQVHVTVCLCLRLSNHEYPFVHLSFCLSICQSVCLPVCLSAHMCVCAHVRVCVCVCARLSVRVCLSGWSPTASVCRSMWCGVC